MKCAFLLVAPNEWAGRVSGSRLGSENELPMLDLQPPAVGSRAKDRGLLPDNKNAALEEAWVSVERGQGCCSKDSAAARPVPKEAGISLEDESPARDFTVKSWTLRPLAS